MPATLQQVSVAPLPDAPVAGFGPLSVLHSDPYKIGQLQYPLEGLGAEEAPHYMTFNINIPTSSKYKDIQQGRGADGKSSTAINSSVIPRSSISVPTAKQLEVGGVVTTLLPLTGGDVPSSINNLIGSAAAVGAAKGITLTPKTQRITTSISLYTPESLLVQYGHEWNSISLTAALGKLGKFASLGASDIQQQLAEKGTQISNIFSKAIAGTAPTAQEIQNALHFNGVSGEFVANIAEEKGVAGPNFADLVLRSQNRAINPKNEMLFQGTANRQFSFNFDFQPRSQKEAFEIYQIIRTFKAFAAPDYSSEGAGRYMIPPALFDIGFFFMNAENLALPRISTCALREIALDYNHSAPFASFNDGFPVHINMQLTFAEIDIITRELIQTFGY